MISLWPEQSAEPVLGMPFVFYWRNMLSPNCHHGPGRAFAPSTTPLHDPCEEQLEAVSAGLCCCW